MAKKGLPAQGSAAIIKALADANDVMLKNEKKKTAPKKTTKKSK